MFNKFAGLQYERPLLKGQPSPLELIYSHYLFRLNIPSDYNDFGFNSFQKIILKIVSMIRKYHNHKLQTTPWHREEEPLNHHETP